MVRLETANGARGKSGAVATENDRAGKRIELFTTTPGDSPQENAFDYSALDEEAVADLRAAAVRVRGHLHRTRQELLAAGNELISIKQKLGHGNFLPFLASELQMTADTAARLMSAARRFTEIPAGAEFTESALYALAAKSTSDEVVEAAMERAAAGHKVTRDDVATLKAIAATPYGRRALNQAAKEVRAELLATHHVERQHNLENMAARNPQHSCGRLFSLGLIDVPRHHNVYSDDTGSEKAPENHYPTMSFRELCDFPIDNFAAPDCIILYWSTAASLVDDLDILAEWGFVSLRRRDESGRLMRDISGDPLSPIGAGRYGSHQIWRKVRNGKQTGTGRWFWDQHEVLIAARRGNVNAPLPGLQSESVFEAAIGAHSAKPHDVVREWVNRCWPHLTKVELFARGSAPEGWVFWGNQVDREGAAA